MCTTLRLSRNYHNHVKDYVSISSCEFTHKNGRRFSSLNVKLLAQNQMQLHKDCKIQMPLAS